MSASDVSEKLRTAAGPDRPPARALGIADPVPVGIAGFAMTTFVLSCVNAGFFGGSAAAPMVLGLAIFYGGLVQLLAGMWAFRRGETFVAVAFCSYGGGFWLSYFFLTHFIAPHLAPSVASDAIGLYLIGWAIFTFYMTIGGAGDHTRRRRGHRVTVGHGEITSERPRVATSPRRLRGTSQPPQLVAGSSQEARATLPQQHHASLQSQGW